MNPHMPAIANGRQPARDELDTALSSMLDEERRLEGLAARREARRRQLMDEDSATFAGALRDMAEHGRSLRITHVGGDVTGRVTAIGRDHAVVEAEGMRTFLRLESIGSVADASPIVGPVAAPRHRDEVSGAGSLATVLRDLAARSAAVVVHLEGHGHPLSGTARTCGEDVFAIVPNQSHVNPTIVQISNIHRVDERR